MLFQLTEQSVAFDCSVPVSRAQSGLNGLKSCSLRKQLEKLSLNLFVIRVDLLHP